MRTEYLGIKLTEEEEAALVSVAHRNGVPKSIFARSIIRAELISLGAITVNNPAPQHHEAVKVVHP
jgi:hypothetical protein